MLYFFPTELDLFTSILAKEGGQEACFSRVLVVSKSWSAWCDAYILYIILVDNIFMSLTFHEL